MWGPRCLRKMELTTEDWLQIYKWSQASPCSGVAAPKARSGRRLAVPSLEGQTPESRIQWKFSLRLPESCLQTPSENNWRIVLGIKCHLWKRWLVDTNGPDLPPSCDAHPVTRFWATRPASFSPPTPSITCHGIQVSNMAQTKQRLQCKQRSHRENKLFWKTKKLLIFSSAGPFAA